jgi:branched-chain amino acid transport system permease protein
MKKVDIIRICLILVFIAIASAAPFSLPSYWTSFLFLFFVYTTLCEMFNLLLGYSGMLALGIHGFVGFGGYMLAITSTIWRLPAWVSVLFSGAMCVLLALGTSFLISRMKGIYFGLGTLITASALFYWFQSWSYAGGGYGMPLVTTVSALDLYYGSLAVAVASILISYVFVRSRIGLRLRAMADDELAAESYGINVFRTKLYCWLLTAFFSGFVGSLYFLYSNFISPSAAFTLYWTLSAITGVLIGGVQTILGPLIGSFIIVWLRQTFLVMFPAFSPLIYGILIIVIMLLFPQGILGALRSLRRGTKNVMSKKELRQ